jgi:hypothetical protein
VSLNNACPIVFLVPRLLIFLFFFPPIFSHHHHHHHHLCQCRYAELLASNLDNKLLEIFQNAYDTCCCAVAPGTLLSWLATNPGEVDEDVVQFNTILFGSCEDR